MALNYAFESSIVSVIEAFDDYSVFNNVTIMNNTLFDISKSYNLTDSYVWNQAAVQE